MPPTATVRVMSAEEIAARGGGEPAALRWPDRSTVFAERAMRLAQLARNHSMGDFLAFMAQLAKAQQAALQTLPGEEFKTPDAAALDSAAMEGRPPLAAADWPRGEAWHGVLRTIVTSMQGQVKTGPAADVLACLTKADAVFLERQADALLTGVMAGLDLAAAPIVAAALQVVFTHLAIEIERTHAQAHSGQPNLSAIGRLDDPGVCPCCGSRPVVSITRSAGDTMGQRYLHCSLCNLEWHRPRGLCTCCGKSEHVAYHSLDRADAGAGDDDSVGSGERAAKAVIQAETCDDCGHYLKIVHGDRDPFADPVADDLASVALDLLVAETGRQRHGVNLMLLFGAPEEEPPGDPARGAP